MDGWIKPLLSFLMVFKPTGDVVNVWAATFFLWERRKRLAKFMTDMTNAHGGFNNVVRREARQACGASDSDIDDAIMSIMVRTHALYIHPLVVLICMHFPLRLLRWMYSYAYYQLSVISNNHHSHPRIRIRIRRRMTKL